MEIRCHLGTACILVKQTGHYRRHFLVIGTRLQVKIFDDLVNELRLHQQNRPIFLFLDLDAQKIADITLIIDSELSGAGS